MSLWGLDLGLDLGLGPGQPGRLGEADAHGLPGEDWRSCYPSRLPYRQANGPAMRLAGHRIIGP